MKRSALIALTLFVSCKPGGEIGALKDALVSGDDAKVARAIDHSPTCDANGGRADDACLARVAAWLGSKTGLHLDPPDQAAAAMAALAVVRGHGEEVPMPDTWLFTIREGNGNGADALRLATATRMAEELTPLARALETDHDARAVMKAVARSIAGACETYAIVGGGIDEARIAPELTVDHSACVQKDLDRGSGPPEHGKYGEAMGPWRGAEGALAIWKETARALREGIPRSDPATEEVLSDKAAVIDADLAKITTKKIYAVDAARPTTSALTAAHADAGVPMAAPKPP